MGSVTYDSNNVSISFTDHNGDKVTITVPNAYDNFGQDSYISQAVDLGVAINVFPAIAQKAYEAGLAAANTNDPKEPCHAHPVNGCRHDRADKPHFNNLEDAYRAALAEANKAENKKLDNDKEWLDNNSVQSLFHTFPAFADYPTEHLNYHLFAITVNGRKPIEDMKLDEIASEIIAIPDGLTDEYTTSNVIKLKAELDKVKATDTHYSYLDTFAGITPADVPAFKFVYIPANGAAKGVTVNDSDDPESFFLESTDGLDGYFTVKNDDYGYRRYRYDSIVDGYVWSK